MIMVEHITKEQAIGVVEEAIGNIINSDSESVNLTDLKIEIQMTITDYTDAADVAPVRHGKWLTPKALIECSECGFGMFPDAYYFDHGECTHHNESWFRPNYCPQCGARMDGGESGD